MAAHKAATCEAKRPLAWQACPAVSWAFWVMAASAGAGWTLTADFADLQQSPATPCRERTGEALLFCALSLAEMMVARHIRTRHQSLISKGRRKQYLEGNPLPQRGLFSRSCRKSVFVIVLTKGCKRRKPAVRISTAFFLNNAETSVLHEKQQIADF